MGILWWEGEWKLIEGLGSGGFSKPVVVEATTDGPQGQLYHLSQDPDEQVNQYLTRPAMHKKLQGRLQVIRR